MKPQTTAPGDPRVDRWEYGRSLFLPCLGRRAVAPWPTFISRRRQQPSRPSASVIGRAELRDSKASLHHHHADPDRGGVGFSGILPPARAFLSAHHPRQPYGRWARSGQAERRRGSLVWLPRAPFPATARHGMAWRGGSPFGSPTFLPCILLPSFSRPRQGRATASRLGGRQKRKCRVCCFYFVRLAGEESVPHRR